MAFNVHVACVPRGNLHVGIGDTPEAALSDLVSRYAKACGAPLPDSVLGWTASGDSFAALQLDGYDYGEIFDVTGAPLPTGTFSYASASLGGGDDSYPGFTAPEIATVFSWGFGAVVFFWFLGQCIGAALGVIRRA